MVCRGIPALAVLLALASGACRSAPAVRPLRTGAEVPAEWLADAPAPATAPGATSLVWVFRTEDCLNCQSFDYAIRRLQALHRDSVPLVAVHVGSPDREQVPRAFFRSRRIDVDRRVTVSPRAYQRAYGPGGLPALLVVREGRVVWSSELPSGVATPAQLDSLVRSVRAAASRG